MGAGTLLLRNEEVCPSADFSTATIHGHHLLYVGMAREASLAAGERIRLHVGESIAQDRRDVNKGNGYQD
jgi:hypothetical protein